MVDRAEINSLNQQIQDLKKLIEGINDRRVKVQSKKSHLESKLNDNLSKKKKELEKSIQERTVLVSDLTEAGLQTFTRIEDHVSSLKSKLDSCQDEIAEVEGRLSELHKLVDEASKDLESRKNEMATLYIACEKQKKIVSL